MLGETSVEERAEKAADLLAAGFSRSGFAAPRLASMPATGKLLHQATDMRPLICTKAARKERMANRDEAGRRIVRSSHLHELNRPRRVVTVGLGGAVGPSPTIVEYADVPIPTPRPDYTPAVAQGG